MQKMQTKPFNRWLSLLMAIIMVVGLIPFGGIIPARATTDDFELPVEGSTGYAVAGFSLGGKNVIAGQPFVILAESGSKLKIRLEDGTEGEVDQKYVLINMPDVIPSIVYNATNSYSSEFRAYDENLTGVTGKAFYTGKTQNTRLGYAEYKR